MRKLTHQRGTGSSIGPVALAVILVLVLSPSVVFAASSPWFPTTSLPIPLRSEGVFVTSSFVYSLGGDFLDRSGIGCPCGATTQTFFAPRLSDGSLGSWIGTTQLPDFRAVFIPVVVNGRAYVIGGHRLDGFAEGSNTAFFAPIQEDGSLGQWSTTTALPISNFAYGVATHGSRIYIVGGSEGFGPRADVLFTKVMSDGTLGSWTFTTP